MIITLDDYWMGRDRTHRDELTHDIIQSAQITVERINHLLDQAADDGVTPGTNPQTGTHVSSGWRPRSINDGTANAALGSKHLIGCACDVRDTGARDLARWCLRNLDALEAIGLWMEDPQWTPTWVHLQIVPPGSGRRVYIPSTHAPLVAKLPEQRSVA